MGDKKTNIKNAGKYSFFFRDTLQNPVVYKEIFDHFLVVVITKDVKLLVAHVSYDKRFEAVEINCKPFLTAG